MRAFGNDFGTDGYDVLREDQRGSIDEPAFGTHDTFGLDVGFDITDSFLLNIGGDVFSEERGNGTPLTGNETEIDSTKIRPQAVTDGGSEWRAGVLYQDQEFASRFSAQAADREFESPALDQFSVPSESLGLNVQWLRPFGSGSSHLVTAGGEYRAAEGQTNERFFFSGGNFIWRREAGGEQELNGFYLQDTWSAGDRWQVQLGARVDRWETLAGFRRETNRNTGFVRREALPEDRSETEVSPRFAVLFSASDTLNVRASAYESFRAPTINELFRPFRVRSDITEANSALVPETLRGFEIGIDGRGRKVRGGVTVFHNEVKDPIANVTIFFGPRFAFPWRLHAGRRELSPAPEPRRVPHSGRRGGPELPTRSHLGVACELPPERHRSDRGHAAAGARGQADRSGAGKHAGGRCHILQPAGRRCGTPESVRG